MPAGQLALAWLLAQPLDVAPIPGAKRVEYSRRTWPPQRWRSAPTRPPTWGKYSHPGGSSGIDTRLRTSAPLPIEMENNMSKVWFITGSSRGFGRELVKAALEAGDTVAATARRPEGLADLATTHGDRILPLRLDVTDAEAARTAIATARQRLGRIDVVVNNAGYANVAPIETGDTGDFRAQFETNFWGVYN
ncbi:MAG: short-chain dehydrogenase/reductase, partial [Mycobacterium sp.]|nr:short-chain dehydrogenase/reductase [Mycobacterium sp.]